MASTSSAATTTPALRLMGTVFLSITGAEALYSDMGHVGRGNIYARLAVHQPRARALILRPGAWIIRTLENPAFVPDGNAPNPFFAMLTPGVRYVAVLLSVIAGIIASQALISGAFTIVSEATRLNWMPHLQVRYPARTRGQLYIPTVNVVLCCSTLLVLLIFRNSEHIAAAYGLALTITMIMTSILVTVYLWHMRSKFAAVLFAIVFPTIMFMFFIASMAKFLHGGWFTMLLALAILTVMATRDEGTKLERAQRRHMSPEDCLPVLQRLHDDDTIPYYADNIVYLTSDTEMKRIDTDIFFSIFASHSETRARLAVRFGGDLGRAIHARILGGDAWHGLPVPRAHSAGIQGAHVGAGVSAPDHARSAAHRRASCAEEHIPEGGCRSGDRPNPLRAHSQGAHARVEGVAKGCDGPAHQVCDSPCRRLTHQMVRLGPV